MQKLSTRQERAKQARFSQCYMQDNGKAYIKVNRKQTSHSAINLRFGQARIKRMMEYVRANLPTEVAGAKVVKVIDYKDGYEDILPSNVLRFFLDNNSWFAIRPSGTEPKIKFYYMLEAEDLDTAKKKCAAYQETLNAIANA